MSEATRITEQSVIDTKDQAPSTTGAAPAPAPRNVLLVAPHYWPSALVGAKRFSFLSRQFERHGYSVRALTLRLHPGDPVDETLPRGGGVHAVRSMLPRIGRLRRLLPKALQIPDKYVGWLPTSVLAGRRLIKAHKPDVIVATGPPFTAFLSGVFLSRISGAKLVLDYRDPWTAFEWGDGRVGRARKPGSVNGRLERWVVRSAHGIVFTTETLRERFQRYFSEDHRAILRVLTNGFDDSRSIEPVTLTPGRINILYAGALHGQRRISHLTDALDVLRREGALGDVQPVIHVFGKIRRDDWQRIADKGLSDIVHEHQPVEYTSILRFMKGADILYLPSGGARAYSYDLPYKVFDYLRVCRPILAVVPRDSAAADLMATVDCGELAYTDDASSVVAAFRRLLTGPPQYSFSGRENYTWDVIAREYTALISAVSDGQYGHVGNRGVSSAVVRNQ